MRYIALLIISAASFVLPLLVLAALPYPFGGNILNVRACDEGLLIYVGPPNPGAFMRTPFSIFFPTIPIISFPILGIALPTPLPCTVDAVPTGEAGLPIIVGGTAI